MWQKTATFAFFLLMAAWVFAALRGPDGLQALADKRERIRALQEQNASIEADNRRKRERLKQLESSPAVQDLEIREKLKLLKPGETQFVLPDSPAEQQPARQ
jgi:cell division protein FtsB